VISKQQCGLFQLGSNRAALNEGREEFRKEDGTGFHKWMTAANLAEVHDHDRAAAMWASGNPEYRTVPRLVGVPATCWNGRHGSLPPTCRLKTIMTASQRCGVATRDTKSNAQFGQWVRNNLLQTENYMDRAAASGVRQVATDGSSRTSVRYVASQLAGPRPVTDNLAGT